MVAKRKQALQTQELPSADSRTVLWQIPYVLPWSYSSIHISILPELESGLRAQWIPSLTQHGCFEVILKMMFAMVKSLGAGWCILFLEALILKRLEMAPWVRNAFFCCGRRRWWSAWKDVNFRALLLSLFHFWQICDGLGCFIHLWPQREHGSGLLWGSGAGWQHYFHLRERERGAWASKPNWLAGK